MKDDRERLLDILEAIERIQRHAREGRKAFKESELLQIWTVHHLQIIGEAARKVSRALQGAHPEIPWTQVIGMRNLLVHDYFGVDLEEVWATVERDLPELKSKIEVVLRQLEK